MTPRRIVVVPHTHWDREWYAPFQSFRLSLVETLDSLLDLMESDPSYARFLLDGQMAVIDDYLEVRPAAEPRLRALAASGRLSMGPWYILMDEFLVSGETIVRNLQMGIERGAAFGGAMEVGYLPDMFGHVAQMPQLLRSAGLSDAVLWRGVPAAIDKTAFDWIAPDGSNVRAEVLPVGYGNGASLPDDAKALVRRAQDHVAEIGSFLLGDLLFMNGSDHLRPQPFLGRVVAEANAIQEDLRFEISSLVEYLATAPREGLKSWRGELRSGARANILMGVTSNRVDVKRAVAISERHLERRAEPFAALFLEPERYPDRLLELAWRSMVLNSAHDSICACSVDEVVAAVLHRAAEARQIAEGVADRALNRLAASMAAPGNVVLNPSARARHGLVEALITGDELDESRVQVISERMGLPGSIVLDATTVKTVLGMLQGPKIDQDAWVQAVSVHEDDEGVHLKVSIGPEENPEVNIGQAKGDLYTKLGARPEASVFVTLDQPRIRRVLARSEEVPGFGWRVLAPAAIEAPASAVLVDGAPVLRNSLVEVCVDPHSGTFSIDGQPGYGRLVDGGDLGDSYNYSPPARDSLVSEPEEVEVSITEEGPVRSSAQVRARYCWPNHIDGGSQQRVGEQSCEVITTISVHADEPIVRVESTFTNPARDHRLRIHLPLQQPAATSEAECAFAIVERGLDAEGRPDELGLPTFPSRRFVRAGGLTVVHEGLNEYELVGIDEDGASELALTALRATGMLSRLGIANRPLPAGPLTPVPGLQLLGETIVARYALSVADVDPYAMADAVLLPLELAPSLGGGDRSSSGSDLTISGAEVSSLRRSAGQLELRIFNPSPARARVELPGRRGWQVDLRGAPIAPFEGGLELGPQQITTLRLSDDR
jgi:alpha-mannosidase